MPQNFGTDDCMLRYKHIKFHFFTNTFFVPEKYRSWRGNKCCQLFVSDIGFVFLVPMQSKGQFPDTLRKFCKEIGVPKSLICDPSGEQTSNTVKKWCNEVALPLQILEEHRQRNTLESLRMLLLVIFAGLVALWNYGILQQVGGWRSTTLLRTQGLS